MASRFDRLFIITYGRSGSTLLQGLLNAIDGYRVYGENGGFLAKLHDAYEALADAHAHLLNPVHDRPSNPWFGGSRYDPESLNAGFRRFVDEMLFWPSADPAVRVYGFKEIRHLDMGEGKLSRLLAFIRQIYPRSAVVFNTRDIDDVLKSGWWRNESRPGLPRQLADFEAFCGVYARANRDHAIHMRYDRLIDPDRREAGRLLAFLGEALTDAAIDAVFAGSHSYQNRALTGYLSGRSRHVELHEPDWWRANVDEFRIDIESRPEICIATGIFLPSVGSTARIRLKCGGAIVEIVGSAPTPRIGELHADNPGSANAGYTIEYPPAEELYLFGDSAEFDNRLIGVVRPHRAAAGKKKPAR